MRVAHFVSDFPKISQTFVLNQLAGLIDAGHEVHVFARTRPADAPEHDVIDEYDLRERVTYTPAPSTYADGVKQLATAIGPLLRDRYDPRTLLSQFRYGKQAPERLAKIRALRRNEAAFDVCHAHFGTVGNRFRGLQRELDCPLAVSFYGADASRMPQQYPGMYDGLFEEAAAVTCLSEDMRGDLRDLGCPDDKLRTVPLCTDTEKFDYRARTVQLDEPVRILTVARFVEKKGLEYAIRAIGALETDREVQYSIAGDGPRREHLEAVISETDAGDQIDLLGWQSQEEISQLLADAHLFVLPSVTAENGDKEGTPTVLLEAQAAGLPVVSTTHAGIPEIVADGESGLLVPERDAEALAEAVATLIDRPERWAEMGRAGRERVAQRHAIETVTDDLVALYRAVD